MEISRLKNFREIESILKRSNLPVMFFTQAQMLDTFFNTENFELYVVEYENKNYLFFQKLRTKELRLLFDIFPAKLVEILKQEFNPPYIAYNELLDKPEKENEIEDKEVVVDLVKYMRLANKRMRKHYNQALRANTSLIFKPFKDISRADLEVFWKTWAEHLSSREKFTDRTYNDARFLDKYDDTTFFGVVAYDGTKIVGYSIGLHHSDGYCLSAFNKALRGYRNLGLQVSYEKAKQATNLGYSKMNLAWINNDFKRQFFAIADLLPIYGYELWRKEDFKTLSPNGYTAALLR